MTSDTVRTRQDIDNLHVYALPGDYFGYNNIGDEKLMKYSMAQVEHKIRDAFHPNVFVEPSINENTSVVIVPDHYNFLPQDTQLLSQTLYVVPFVYILHPGITAKNLKHATAPGNASVIYAMQQLTHGGSHVPKNMIQTKFASPQEIQDILSNYGNQSFNKITMSGSAPNMKDESIPAQPKPPVRRGSLRYQQQNQELDKVSLRNNNNNNNNRKASLDRNSQRKIAPNMSVERDLKDKPTTRRPSLERLSSASSSSSAQQQQQQPKKVQTPSWHAHIDAMRAEMASQKNSLQNEDSDEYTRAWRIIRARK